MSLRYAPLYIENQDALTVEFWNQGLGDLGGEITSGLDRDNIAQSTIINGDLTANVFFETFYSATDTGYSPDAETTAFQNGTGTSTGANNLGILSITLDQDAHLDVHWNGTWEWSTSVWSHTTTSPADRLDWTDTFSTVTLQVDVDGVVLFVLGPFEDAAKNLGAYGVGSIQLPAGPHVIKVRVKCVRIIAQTGQEDGTINYSTAFTCPAPTFGSRSLLAVARYR